MMKKVFGAMLLLATLSGCQFKNAEDEDPNDNMIWDIAPVVFQFEIFDKDGNNLFLEGTTGNWLQGPVSATFEGKTYTFPKEDEGIGEVETKEYLAVLDGFKVMTYGGFEGIPKRTVLEFGELAGDENRTSDIVITWPDGSTDTATIDNVFKWKKDGTPSRTTHYYLNGKETVVPIPLTKLPLEGAEE